MILVFSMPISYLMQYNLNSIRGYIIGLIGSTYIIVEYCNRDLDFGSWVAYCLVPLNF
jgi:hypothetical protein